ncbi:NAD(P)/FAD-dependent oxidoreductase [Roseomonas elaeocarpi]|uniref:NAD(P)/FAD-dependent oxidoreductase n=1 Tax=Roseomonas elaeocarpi TaxID=907779 RepID=A0ABV6JS35_9PROT
MPPQIDTVPSDTEMPAQAEVVVIGGGVIGVSTALFLRQRGLSVVLCEKGQIAGEQSSRNWGWVRTMGRDPAEIPLSLESQRIWQGLERSTGAETGFRQSGILYLCDTERDVAKYEQWLEQARPYQIGSRLLSQAELAAKLPGLQRRFAGALYTESDGRAEPMKAVPALAAAARREGVTILAPCAVRGVETTGGRLSAVVTERGAIRCGSAVLAGGAWSRLFCGNLGIDLPQLKILGSVLRTQPIEGLPELAAGASDFAFRRRFDGGYNIAHRGASVAEIVPDTFRQFFEFLPALRAQWGTMRLRLGRRFVEEWRIRRRWAMDEVTPFEEVRMLDPEPDAHILDEAMRNLRRALPGFAAAKVAGSWGGLIDATPDAVPIMDQTAQIPGLFVATGFSGHGFGIGPGAGRLMADLVTGRDPVVDATPFRLNRFRRDARRAAA